jgi:hypothetical protein
MPNRKTSCLPRPAACVAGLALVLLAGAALAQKAERPEVKAGDRWTFSVSEAGATADRNWVIKSVTPSRIEGTENGKPLALTPDLNEIESPRGKDSDRRLLKFPLEIGKKWTFADDYTLLGSKRSARASIEVVGYEKVRVPAGEFDAFKLVGKSSWINRKAVVAGDFDATYWYAPAARAIVKYRSQSNETTRPANAYELVKFRLQP